MNVGYAGLMVPNAHISISHYRGEGDKLKVSVSFKAFKTNKQLFEHWYDVPLDLNSPDNFLKQAYNHIKTLKTPIDFSNAKDI